MSTTVDQRVVEMQFDNRHFERNVSTTMSTLDKLKQRLNLKGASKGLEDVNTAAKKVDMRGLGDGVETVRAKFSALQVMGVTALTNITNQAVNAGKRIVSALTIDPIKTGFQEYETQINAVQTILANTQSKGTTLDDVNKALDTLNAYADKTIYNFTEMTRNIGTFTAAGVDLETSANAIQGIANLAAVSGSNAQQASTAMYQLSQALASGTVKLMDWNSVVNAGMGGQVFQDALKETARVHGVAIDSMIEEQGSFRETLSEGWLTSEILTETLQKFTLTTEGLTDAQIKANREMLRSKGYTEEQIDEIFKLGKTATEAATKVKTFSQLWDTLKEAAQSGWTQTWELIVGDFEQAKSLLTGISDYIGDFINKISEARNKLLEGVLRNPFKGITDKLSSLSTPAKKAAEAMNNVTRSLEDYQNIVSSVWRGDYGNGLPRFSQLETEGWSSDAVQELVNLGYGYTVTMEDVNRVTEKYGVTVGETSEAVYGAAESTEAMTLSLDDLNVKQLRQLGLNEEEIQSFLKLREACHKAGIAMDEYMKDASLLDGRTLLINSFKNAWTGVVDVLGAVKDAWQNIFPPTPIEERQEQIYGIIASIHKFSLGLKDSGDVAGKVERIFKGLFAALDIVLTLVRGPLGWAFKALKEILSTLDIPILDILANIGDGIVKIRDYIDSVFDFSSMIAGIAPHFQEAIKGARDWFASLKDSDNLAYDIGQGIVKGIKAAVKLAGEVLTELGKEFWAGISGILGEFGIDTSGFTETLNRLISDFRAWLEELKTSDNIPADIIQGLVNGLSGGVGAVVDAVIALGQGILAGIKEVLGIHSPSTEFAEVGSNIIAGLIQGLQNGASAVWEFVKGIGQRCIDAIKGVDFGKILAVGIGAGLLVTIFKVADTVQTLVSSITSITSITDAIAGVGESISGYFDAKANVQKAKSVRIIAVAIALLAGSLYLISKIDKDRLWASVGALAALAGIVAVLGLVVVGLDALSGKINKGGFGIKQSLMIIALAGSLLLLSMALAKIAEIDGDDIKSSLVVMAGIVGGLAVFSLVLAAVGNVGDALGKVGSMLLKVSLALLIMVGVIKLIGTLNEEEIRKGIVVIAAVGALFAVLTAISYFANESAKKAGKMLIKASIALLIMVGVIKLASMLTFEEVLAGIAVIAAVGGLFVALIAVSRLAGKNASKAGSMLLMMAGAMLILTYVIEKIAELSDDEIKRGLIIVGSIELLFAGLIAATKLAGNNAIKAGAFLLLMSGALVILTGILFILSKMDPEGLYRGLAIVSVLELLFSGLVMATKNVPNKCVGALIILTTAVVILAGVVIALSFLDPKKVTVAAGAMAALVGVLSLLVFTTKFAKDVKVTTLMTLVGVVAVLGGIVYALSVLDTDGSLLSKIIALSTLVLALSGALVILQYVGKSTKSALGGVLALTAMVVPLVAFALALHLLPDISGAKENILALFTVMTAMTILLVPLTLIGLLWVNALAGVLALTAMVVPLVAFGLALHLLPDVSGAYGNVIILTAIMTAMTALLIPLTLIGLLWVNALAGALALTAMVVPLVAFALALHLLPDVSGAYGNVVLLSSLMAAMTVLLIPLSLVGILAIPALAGVLALTAMVIPLSAFALALHLLPDVTDSIGNVVLLSNLMSFLTDLLVKIAPIGPLALIGVVALAGLEALMISFGVLATAVGALMTEFPALQDFLDTGIPVLEQLASGLGSVIGSFITGFAGEVMTILPELGTCLSSFMSNASVFIDGAKSIDDSVLTGVGILAGAVLALTAADLVSGISSFLSGGSSFADLGVELSAFMANASGFIDGASALDPAMTEGVKALAETLLILTEADILDGLTSWLTGGASLADFGAELALFGPSLKTFSDAVKDVDNESILAASEAAKNLAEMAKNIPNSGGWVGAIFGENDAGTFGEQLKGLGQGIKDYGVAVSGIEAYTESINASVDAAQSLSDLAEHLPNSGGFIADFLGDNSMADFGSQLQRFGWALMNYGVSVSGIGEYTESIATSVTAAQSLSDMAEALPNSGGFITDFLGDNTMSDFGAQLKQFGLALMNYGERVNGITDYMQSIRSSVTAAKLVADVAEEAKALGKGDFGEAELVKFGEDLVEFGASVKTYSDNVSSIDTAAMGAATTQFNRVVNMVKNMDGLDFDSLSSFGDALGEVGADGVNSFIESFSDADSEVISSGEGMIDNLITGIENKESSLSSAVKEAADDAADAAEDKYSAFKSAGKYLVDGFAEGITERTWKAEARARAMAQAAADAAENELDINSPSKVFRRIGFAVPEGFAQGIDRLSGLVGISSKSMARTALDNVRSTVGRITDMVNMNIDSQPTIRPVLDLSDVESGAGLIGNMLGFSAPIEAIATAGAINSMMNRRVQNGSNHDVVSAIKDLGKGIEGMDRATYNVNGVTYDDGSNISTAVKTIVRAAKIERRV